MRLKKSVSRNAVSYYVIEDIYVDGKRTTRIYESLGTHAELLEKLNGEDPETWAREYIKNLNDSINKGKVTVIEKYSNTKRIPKGNPILNEAGYLFLQSIFSKLSLDKAIKKISAKYQFEYDLSSIFSTLIFTRILHPSSKRSSFESAKSFVEPPNFDLHHVYRGLEIIAKECDFLEETAYKNSLSIVPRDSSVLYYDCTNYFFETEITEGLKQYGVSKENRPNPIVQMGLFLDASGLPLAFSIFDGNINEQPSLKPLEKRILKDFSLSDIVVCTDAGLSSYDNRKFNNYSTRHFVTTQSIKKLKKYLKEWALSGEGFKRIGSDKLYSIDEISELGVDAPSFYKERWINDDGLEQRLIITYSNKHRIYQRNIRANQIERALKQIDNPQFAKRKRTNDPSRFVSVCHVTDDGEVADNEAYGLNYAQIEKEEIYDGYYGICTNLDWDISRLLEVNKQRWRIEDAFRTLKTEFKARPVYLKRDDRIKAHFATCFFALLIFRILEKKIGEICSSSELLKTLKGMNLIDASGKGYIPTFERTDLTDILHEKFGFRLDTEIVDKKTMKKIIKSTKSN